MKSFIVKILLGLHCHEKNIYKDVTMIKTRLAESLV